MQTALSNLNSVGMQANRMNVDAMELLTEHRGSEAVSLLLKALSLDPDNPFTKNNLGVANESIGDYDAALKYYGAAASSNSNEAVVVTLDRSWRGKLIREMAAQSATRLEQRMKKIGTIQSNILMLSLRGVSETNHNNWVAARQDFLQAYSLDPSSAFSLNNRGYVAERDGDMETAQFYYAQARKADDSNTRIGMATLQSAEGRKLSTVAADSDRQVDSELEIYKQKRRQRSGPIELTPRGDASNEDPGVPPKVPAPADVPPAVEVPTPQPQ
jgi:Flp pilus assembly protein TadD